MQAVNSLQPALCGARDWRMPWREELRSIADYSRVNPGIDVAYFEFQRSSNLWSGSPYAGNSGFAWYVYFYNGKDSFNDRSLAFRVRLVRGGQ